VPTVVAAVVLLTAAQMLFRRQHVWLPGILLNRSVARRKLDKPLPWLRHPTRLIDSVLPPRLMFLATGTGRSLIALSCMVIAAAMLPMELVPFTANGAGLALTAFGLAVIARDGLLALLSFLLTAGTIGVVIDNLL
jgi:hypothetical protein